MDTSALGDLTAIGEVDLVDPRVHAEQDLYPLWHHLRDNAPVYRHPARDSRPSFWVITRYSDVLETARDDDHFTSEKGNVLDTLLAGGDSAAGSMLPVTDGKRHTEIRRLLMKTFTPRALQHVIGHVRASTEQLVLDALGRGGCDMASDIAAYIPLITMCDLLNVPLSDREFILKLTKSVLGSAEADQSAEDAWLAKNEILLYFTDLANLRRAAPLSDVVSTLAAGRIDGEPLTEAEAVLNIYSVILGGDETTRLSMTGAVHALMQNGDQWLSLRDGDVDVDSATEEVLRWTCVPAHFGRTATSDVMMHGTRIAAGDAVTGWLCSANRDEDIFDQPEHFDLARHPNKHLSFGHGAHFCPGSYLGRFQISALLDVLRTHVGDIEPAGTPQHIYSNFFHGINNLPITLKPKARRGN